jgi:hypothetical protein
VFCWSKEFCHANDNTYSIKLSETKGVNMFGDTIRFILPMFTGTATLLFRGDIRITTLFLSLLVSRDTRHSCCTIGWPVANIGQRHPQSGIDRTDGMQSQAVMSHRSLLLHGESPQLEIIKTLQFKFYNYLPSVHYFVQKLNLEPQHLRYKRAESQACS